MKRRSGTHPGPECSHPPEKQKESPFPIDFFLPIIAIDTDLLTFAAQLTD